MKTVEVRCTRSDGVILTEVSLADDDTPSLVGMAFADQITAALNDGFDVLLEYRVNHGAWQPQQAWTPR